MRWVIFTIIHLNIFCCFTFGGFVFCVGFLSVSLICVLAQQWFITWLRWKLCVADVNLQYTYIYTSRNCTYGHRGLARRGWRLYRSFSLSGRKSLAGFWNIKSDTAAGRGNEPSHPRSLLSVPDLKGFLPQIPIWKADWSIKLLNAEWETHSLPPLLFSSCPFLPPVGSFNRLC